MRSNDLDFFGLAQFAMKVHPALNSYEFAASHDPEREKAETWNMLEEYTSCANTFGAICDIIDMSDFAFLKATRVIWKHFGDSWKLYPDEVSEIMEYFIRHSHKSDSDSIDRAYWAAWSKIRK